MIIGRIPSILVVALSAFLVLGAFGWVTIGQISELGKRLPEYRGKVIAKAGSLGAVGRAIKAAQAALADVGDEIAASTAVATARENISAATKVEIVPSPPKPLEIIGRAGWARSRRRSCSRTSRISSWISASGLKRKERLGRPG